MNDTNNAYSYLYGVVSARQDQMLAARDFSSLWETRSLEQAYSRLDGTPYEQVIRNSSAQEPLEKTLEKAYLDAFTELRENIPKKDIPAFEAMYVARLDHQNLKTILRGILSSHPPQLIQESLDYPGFFSSQRLQQLTQLEDVEQFITAIEDTPYHKLLHQTLLNGGSNATTTNLEHALDEAYLNLLLKAAKKSPQAKQYLDAYVDVKNITNIIRYNLEETPPANKTLFMQAGSLNPRQLDSLSQTPIEAIPDHLAATPYRQMSQKIIQQYENTKSIAATDFITQQTLIDFIREKARIAPLSIYSILDYLEKKKSEVMNLSAILVGKQHHLKAANINLSNT